MSSFHGLSEYGQQEGVLLQLANHCWQTLAEGELSFFAGNFWQNDPQKFKAWVQELCILQTQGGNGSLCCLFVPVETLKEFYACNRQNFGQEVMAAARNMFSQLRRSWDSIFAIAIYFLPLEHEWRFFFKFKVI